MKSWHISKNANIAVFCLFVVFYAKQSVDTLRPQYVNSFCKLHLSWEYWDILAQKIMHEDLV